MQENPTRENDDNNVFHPDSQPLYFNGFTVAIGTGDVVIALQLNGKPIQVLNTSYTVAKTLAEGLSKIIGELEQKTGSTIMTIQTIAKAMSQANE